MKTLKLLFNSVMITLFVVNIAFAQFHLSIGGNTGMNYNIGTGSDLEETMTGFGFVIGATADMDFSQVIGLNVNLQFYDGRNGSNATEGTVQGIPYTLHQEASLAYFAIEPLLKIMIPGSGLFFLFGPAIGFNISGTSEVRLTSENNQVTFADGSTKIKSSIKNTLVRFALKAGVSYDIKLGAVYLTPALVFDYGITNVQSDVSSHILSFQALAYVKYAIL